MALIINQGKQDTTQDNRFEPIVEKGVLAQIMEIKLSSTQTNTLEITMRLLNGQHKGRFVFDRINYDPTSQFSWKYRAVRKAAGCPYNENESAQIDIEKLLLNKAVTLDLGIRKGKNSAGEEQEYQNITYKVLKQEATAETPAPETAAAPAKETTEPVSADIQPIPDLTDDTDWD